MRMLIVQFPHISDVYVHKFKKMNRKYIHKILNYFKLE